MKTTMKLCKSSFGRLIAFILCFVMTFTFIPFIDSEGTTANATTPTIEIGDYVQMGTYSGAPILWRCVAFYKVEEDGTVDFTDTETEYKKGYLPLMLSDRILCVKSYDAKGSAKPSGSSHSRGSYRSACGSNYWGDSNIKCWLNSNETSVNWTCGNSPSEGNVTAYPYDNEAGFLTNFTEIEKNCMKVVSQYQLLEDCDKAIKDAGTYTFVHVADLGNFTPASFAGACKKKIEDTMFLPAIDQIYELYKNREILGDYYYMAKPTPELLKEASIENWNGYVDYRLSSPQCRNGYSSNTTLVDKFGSLTAGYDAYRSSGVRPAFYLDFSSANFLSGDGSYDAPYSLEEGPDVTVDFANERTKEIIDNTMLYKKKGDGEWTSGSENGGYIGLDPNETYYFKYETATAEEKNNYAVTVTTIPSKPDTPLAPTVNSKTCTTVTLSSTDGCEYKCGDNGKWQDSNVFTGLTAGQRYKFYQRVKATNSAYSSDTSKPLEINTLNSLEVGPNVTVDFANERTKEIIDNTMLYKKKGDGEWTSGSETGGYIELDPNETYYFKYETATAEAKNNYAQTVITIPPRPNTPLAPTVNSKTDTTVTLSPTDGCEYKCGDNGKWQDSNVFTGLTAGQSYNFYQRVKASDIAFCSETSEPLEVKTLTYGEAITSAVGITGVTAYLVAVAKNKLISKWFLTSNGIFGKKVNSWVKNLWTNMLH